jgi:hypothetical protein
LEILDAPEEISSFVFAVAAVVILLDSAVVFNLRYIGVHNQKNRPKRRFFAGIKDELYCLITI